MTLCDVTLCQGGSIKGMESYTSPATYHFSPPLDVSIQNWTRLV